MSFLLPTTWSRRRGHDVDDAWSDIEEGEGMVGFEVDAGRRQELERITIVDGGGGERRLSRDLEEGFRDDSDDDRQHDRRRVSTGS